MKSINIVECKNEDDLKEVAILAEKIWHEFLLIAKLFEYESE